jgi:hypothetical protein
MVRDQVGRDPAFPASLFVYMGTPEQGGVLTDLWPEVRAIADPDARLYDAFGLTRGGFGQVLSPRVWLRGFQAMARGHSVGRPVGDVWRMPGYFLIEAGHVTWYYRPRDSADHPHWDAVPHGSGARA